MPTFENALGIHTTAVKVRAERAKIIAANLANADTPNYKARDIDFRAALANVGASAKFGPGLKQTNQKHFDIGSHALGGNELMYRTPSQASMDQNTVDVAAERSEFLDNALRYQASLRFLEGKFSGLRAAFRGE